MASCRRMHCPREAGVTGRAASTIGDRPERARGGPPLRRSHAGGSGRLAPSVGVGAMRFDPLGARLAGAGVGSVTGWRPLRSRR
jgi:hypothetical protein